MPRGDGSGPAGMGPMTGRAAGYCAGFNAPGFANAGGRFGAGVGIGGGFGRRGGGRGRRNMFYATGMPGWMRFGGYASDQAGIANAPVVDPAAQKAAMKSQVDALEGELAYLKKRLSELEDNKSKG